MSEDHIQRYAAAELVRQQRLDPNVIFVLARNKNCNLVVYRARRHARVGENMVSVDWHMADTDTRTPLSALEHKVFGPVCPTPSTAVPHGYVEMHTAAAPNQKWFVHVPAEPTAVPFAITQIQGQWSYLKMVYVRRDDSSLLPRVASLQVSGNLMSDPTVHVSQHIDTTASTSLVRALAESIGF